MEECVALKDLVHLQSVDQRWLLSFYPLKTYSPDAEGTIWKTTQMIMLNDVLYVMDEVFCVHVCLDTHLSDLRLSFSMLFSGPSLSYEARCSSAAIKQDKGWVSFVFTLDNKLSAYCMSYNLKALWFIYDDTCSYLIARYECILTVFTEDRRGDEILEDAAVSVEWTNDLTPNQELAHLLCKLPQFLLRHSDNRLYYYWLQLENRKMQKTAQRGIKWWLICLTTRGCNYIKVLTESLISPFELLLCSSYIISEDWEIIMGIKCF